MTFLFCVLLVSLSFAMGCYSHQSFSRDQLTPGLRDALTEGSDRRDIALLMTDSVLYRFPRGDYRVQRDSLRGSGVQIIGGREKPFQGDISLAGIASIKTEEFNVSNTIAAVILLSGLVIGFIWAAAALSNGF